MSNPVIKSNLLSRFPELIHGVSTKAGGNPPYYNNMSRWVGDDIDEVIKNREAFFAEIGANGKGTVHANQVHSANGAVVTEPGLAKETDALITNKRGLFLIISVADCLPIMMYDKSNGVIANVHSGWRGTAAGIVTATIEKMKAEFRTDPADLIAFSGPGIGKDCFEVGPEVAEQFESRYVFRPPLNPLLPKEGTLKLFIDLKQVVADQLLSAGVKQGNIEISPYCTFTEKDMLHSYRRDREKSGRMFAVIGLK